MSPVLYAGGHRTGSHLAVGELLEIIWRHVLELREHGAPLRPLPVGAVLDFADDGFKFVAVDVGAELVGIQALGSFHRLRQHLPGGITERHKPVTQRIDFLASGDGAITLEHIGDAGEIEGRRRHEALHDDEAVKNRTKLRLDRRDQQSDHGAAEHFRLEPDLVRSPDNADCVRRIRGYEHDIGICGLNGAHGRCKIRGRRGIALVINDLETVSRSVLARAVCRGARELGVARQHRDRLRLWVLLPRQDRKSPS